MILNIVEDRETSVDETEIYIAPKIDLMYRFFL